MIPCRERGFVVLVSVRGKPVRLLYRPFRVGRHYLISDVPAKPTKKA